MRVNKLLTIEGRVQHVGFRYSARNVALNYAISGFARNLPDGSVYIEAEGEEEEMFEFIHWCQHGPPLAKVTRVKIQDGNLMNYSEFAIG